MRVSFHHLRRFGVFAALVVAVAATSGGDALAQDIPAGSDNYFILPSSTVVLTSADLTSGFFGPGSDPFDGTVCLAGDTTIDRLGDGIFVGNPPETTVPIELVALDLVSCEPIIVVYHGGQNPEQWDLRILLPGPPAGTLTATKTHANGGTYDSILTVQPIFIFTRVGAPAQTAQLNLDPFDLISMGDPWSDQNPVGVPPNASNFYPGGTPGDPSVAPGPVPHVGGPIHLNLVLVPEPATLAMLAAGALAILRRRNGCDGAR